MSLSIIKKMHCTAAFEPRTTERSPGAGQGTARSACARCGRRHIGRRLLNAMLHSPSPFVRWLAPPRSRASSFGELTMASGVTPALIPGLQAQSLDKDKQSKRGASSWAN